MLTRKVKFHEIPSDEDPCHYGVTVDGILVIPDICETDLASYALDPLWEAIGIEIEFINRTR